ncbi:MAG TPA: universal stress protein [Polyangiaceae bacterium]|jgi:nucleotide-binding universal stress UspA family protein|nr:universal stress protein [Polyangiaceae bacterium]
MDHQKILVPVDYSPSSRLALEWALSLADRLDSTVHVLHTWEVPAYLRPDLTVWSGEVSETLADHTRVEAEKGMRLFLADANAAERPNVTSQVVGGAPYSTIIAMATEGAFDMIAMGTHGRSGVAHLVMGSVAEKVVRHAPCPVLTIRAPA